MSADQISWGRGKGSSSAARFNRQTNTKYKLKVVSLRLKHMVIISVKNVKNKNHLNRHLGEFRRRQGRCNI